MLLIEKELLIKLMILRAITTIINTGITSVATKIIIVMGTVIIVITMGIITKAVF